MTTRTSRFPMTPTLSRTQQTTRLFKKYNSNNYQAVHKYNSKNDQAVQITAIPKR